MLQRVLLLSFLGHLCCLECDSASDNWLALQRTRRSSESAKASMSSLVQFPYPIYGIILRYSSGSRKALKTAISAVSTCSPPPAALYEAIQ